ncbi:hypothetical protein FB567DRAFT_537169 [Paraphoma chrysanthemicola]|uniref:Uncharacterized protein n=1 Tax=Paraphoma chrysanthemicola TaxID=798071 RepID=A0A8K0QWW0_9PLEO|nr:hypothetical protein FB567DRAFT_537169 [Paraphoma chrysanthemicola]
MSNHASHSANEPIATPKGLGVLAATIANIAAVTVGVDASDTVAIQCIGGRSIGKYFVFNGAVQLSARYNGMRSAFQEDNEIFVPQQVGGISHLDLRTADYDRLLTNVESRFQALVTPAARVNLGPHVFPGIPVNHYLVEKMTLPIWKWSFRRKGVITTYFCAFCALLPMLIIALVRLGLGFSMVPELLYAIIFALISAYGGYLLDVKREVTYIQIKENDISPSLGALWVRTLNRATAGPPTSAHEAVRNVATGHVRKNDNTLLVPVMAFMPTFEYSAAEWVFLLTNLRGPLLTMPYVMAADPHHRWLVAYGIAAFAQASLQNAYAKSFLAEAKPYKVDWFRRLPYDNYREEFPRYRMRLEVD